VWLRNSRNGFGVSSMRFEDITLLEKEDREGGFGSYKQRFTGK
jgi:hypothetical protein